jgi:DDE superfamily endonuclease
MNEIYKCLGPIYFRRAYRMSYTTFWVLCEKLETGILSAVASRATRRRAITTVATRDYEGYKDNGPPIPNGSIPTSVRLACALRYLAGANAYDLMTTYGVSHTTVLESVWFVIHAVNMEPSFHIEYPDDHDKQHEIASEFCKASGVEFDNCAGAIDGILIWIHKPSEKDAADSGMGQKPFLCGRKHKFGLNCQAVSDLRGRFLNLSINYGGSSSDCLAFEASDLWQRLEDGLLALGLVLFGDNAYLNTTYMVTPFTNVSQGSKDDYNFYHSQLRIRVECAFGMLVHRWGILRSIMPLGITIKKAIALVSALARLHNFCIDHDDNIVPETTGQDTAHLMMNVNGYVPLEQNELCDVRTPRQLLDGGNHFDDVPWASRRDRSGIMLPRALMLQKVIDSHQVRPRLSK